MKLLLLRQREEVNALQRHEVKGGKDGALIHIYIRTHPFFLKRDFSKRLLNDEFQKFWEKKKRKKSRCQPSGLYNGIFTFIISSPEFYFSFFTAFMMISK